MLSLTAPIKTRLQALPALTGWAVRTNAEDADRATVPAADLRCLGASVADRRGSGVLVSPEWTVTLVVRRSATAAQEIDAALAAVIEALHGWMPGQQQGRGLVARLAWQQKAALGQALGDVQVLSGAQGVQAWCLECSGALPPRSIAKADAGWLGALLKR